MHSHHTAFLRHIRIFRNVIQKYLAQSRYQIILNKKGIMKMHFLQMKVVEKLYFLDSTKLEYWRNLFLSLLSENNMSFRKYIIQISTYCLLMHLCKFLEIEKPRIVLIICHRFVFFQHLIQPHRSTHSIQQHIL